MAYSEDHIALAAEYALGTLDADERTQVETMMAVDREFAAVVQAWEFRLGVLNQMVGSVEPRPLVWDNIRRAIGHGGEQAPLVLPEAPPPIAPEVPEANDNIAAPSRRWWPRCRTSSSSIAACGAGATSQALRLRSQRRCW